MSLESFSEYFKLDKSQFELDFVDVLVNNGDIALFIDPYAISRRNDNWSVACNNMIVSFFQEVVNAIRNGNNNKAMQMLSGLHEPNETRLGLSRGRKPRGRGVGDKQAEAIYIALSGSTAVKTGFLKDLHEAELLIDGIGRDKVSDMTTNIIREKLTIYTQHQCMLHNIDMQEVPSGQIWNEEDSIWKPYYHLLPVCYKKPVLLIPKAIARYSLEFTHDEYYDHHVINFLQAEHLSANSSLVRVLKNGKRKAPFKKDLKKLYPISKQFLYEFSMQNPDVLRDYLLSKKYRIHEITNEGIEVVNKKQRTFDYNELGKKLSMIKPGNKYATEYHNHIKGVLTAIFYPNLLNPQKEREIHEGRKRIDIVYENAESSGFFRRLPQNKQVPSGYIFIECKNYSSDPANPELDQLAGRFSINRGKFGFLVCRRFKNKKLFYKRCRDTAQDDRGFIIPLDDTDIKKLLKLKSKNDSEGIDKFLDEAFRKIVM